MKKGKRQIFKTTVSMIMLVALTLSLFSGCTQASYESVYTSEAPTTESAEVYYTSTESTRIVATTQGVNVTEAESATSLLETGDSSDSIVKLADTFTYSGTDNDYWTSHASSASLTQVDGVYQITSAADLAFMASKVNDYNDSTYNSASFILTANIDLLAYEWVAIGVSGTNYQFTGTFDGDGYEISGLYIDESSQYQGLFGTVGSGGIVKNVNVTSGSVTGTSCVGGIVGNNMGTVENCSFAGEVSGGSSIGGIAGYNSSAGKVYNSYNTGTVVESESTSYVGGIVGQNAGTVYNSYNAGAVSGSSRAGGIVGYNTGSSSAYATVINCYNIGSVTTTGSYAGGVVGYNYTNSYIYNCYNTGVINSYYNSGVAGYNNGGTVKSCYAYADSLTGSLYDESLQGDYVINSYIFKVNDSGVSFVEGDSDYTSYDDDTCVDDSCTTLTAALNAYVDSYSGDLDLNSWIQYDGDAGGEAFAVLWVIGNWSEYVDVSWYNAGQTSIEISTAAELAGLADLVNGTHAENLSDTFENKTITLTADIDLSAHEWTAIGYSSSNSFKGTFDGGGYEISGLYIDETKTANETAWVGLFGYISGATIQNVGVVDSSITATSTNAAVCVGGIAGESSNSTILNCYFSGSIFGETTSAGSGGNAGGMVGYGASTNIYNCYNTGDIESVSSTGASYAGGIAGYNTNGSGSATVANCYSTGNVTSTSTADLIYLGGILGYRNSGTITNCYYLVDTAIDSIGGDGMGTGSAGGLASFTSTGSFGQTSLDDVAYTDASITIGDKECTTLLSALNAYVEADTSGLVRLWEDNTGEYTEDNTVTLTANSEPAVLGDYPIVATYADGDVVYSIYSYGDSEATTAGTDSAGVEIAEGTAGISGWTALYAVVDGGYSTVSGQDTAKDYTLNTGNYYLAENITTTKSIAIGDGTNETAVTLALNGKTIEYVNNDDGATTASVITVQENATLDLYGNGEEYTYTNASSKEIEYTGGLITGGTGTSMTINNSDGYSGGGVYVGGGTFHMYSGTIAGNTVSFYGGGIYVQSGTFTMNGGTIAGNTAAAGGGVYADGGIFTMSGGAILGNTANGSYGGGVVVCATFTMTGGEISGNEATTVGGGIYVIGSVTFNISGAPVISGNKKTSDETASNVYLTSGKSITVIGALSEDANIGVTMAEAGDFANSLDSYTITSSDKGYFSVDDSDNYYISFADSKLSLVEFSSEPSTGSDWIAITDIDGDGIIEFGEMESNTISDGGNYYLAMDITTTATITIDGESTLDLNGHTISYAGYSVAGGYASVITIPSGADVKLQDSDEDGGGTIKGGSGTYDGSSRYGGGVYVAGTLTMESGAIDNNSASYGGGVYVSGTFTMNGGTISENTGYSGGGGVYVASTGKFTMNNSTISSNTASNSTGGGVYVYGTFDMEGGTITGNSATASTGCGGGVYVYSGTFTMNGGTISDNSTPIPTTITYNTYGGGVYVTSGKFTMEGGTISGNSSKIGGGVSLNSSTFTMKGGKISGNNASTAGGIYVANSTVEMNDGTITLNTASADGGGVYFTSYSTFSMNNGTITLNSTDSNGGGVYIATYSKLSMSGGSITSNTAGSDGFGGGVYYSKPSSDLYTSSISRDAIIEDNVLGGTILGDETNGYTLSDGTANNAYFESGASIIVSDELTKNASVGITMADGSGTIASIGTNGVYYNGCFFQDVDKDTHYISASDSEVSLKEFTEAPDDANGTITWQRITDIDGDGIIEIGGAELNEVVDGETTTASNTISDGGNYYLAMDVATTSTISISGTSTLDLNGHTINYVGDEGDSSENASVISVHGDVIVQDSNKAETESGGVITGGTGTAVEDYTYGGGVYVTGSFTMTGGTISGNTASYGGGVYVDDSFTMTGGTISDNTATYGGGVYVDDSFIMTGGTISGNKNGGVYVANGVMNVSGSPIVDGNTSSDGETYVNVYLDSEKFIVITGELSSDAKIGVASSSGVGTVVFGAVDDDETDEINESYAIASSDYAVLFSDLDGYYLLLGDNEISVIKPSVPTDDSYSWDYVITDLDSDGIIEINGEVLEGNKIATDGDYYLGMNINITETITVSEVVNLSLNGYVIDGSGVSANDAVITVSGTLNLYGDGKEHTYGNISYTGGLITGGSYGGVYVANGGTFNMHAGTIAENEAVNGGGVYVIGTLNMSGGSIEDNTASANGGGIAGSGTIKINDTAIISGNTASADGGGVYMASGGSLVIAGGTIASNGAVNGGGVYLDTVAFEMSGGSISGNKAENGGGVYADLTSAGYVSMTTGEISGNTASSSGGGIYFCGGTFNISGTPVISGNAVGGEISYNETTGYTVSGGAVNNVYLPDGTKLSVSNLSTDAKIGVSMENGTGAFTSGAVEADMECFTPDNDTYSVVYLDGEVQLIKLASEPTTSVGGAWQAITDMNGDGIIEIGETESNTISKDGYYYLAMDINTTSTIEITDNVTIDLNDCDITAQASVDNKFSVITVNGTLTLEASTGVSTISGGYAENGGGIYVVDGEVDLAGDVRITENEATGDGGGIYVAGGVVTIDGCGITYNQAQSGGGIYIAENGTVTMIDGDVSFNLSTADGGGIYDAGTLNISGTPYIDFNYKGGEFINDVNSDGTANNLYLADGKTITIDAELVVYTYNDVDGVTHYDYPTIYVTMESGTGVVAVAGDGVEFDNDYLAYFISEGTDDYFQLSDNTVVMKQFTAEPDSNKTWRAITDINSDGVIETTALRDDGKLYFVDIDTENASNTISGDGYYYLAMDICSSSTITFSGIATLDLNGHVIEYTGVDNASVITVKANATLDLYGDGEEYTYNNITYTGGLITGGSGTVNSSSYYYGGGVHIAESGTFNMYDGTIAGNSTTSGGGVYVYGAEFNMYGGSITGNTASEDGGGVYAAEYGTFNMCGGTISDNTASNGSGAYVNTFGTFIMTGGEISDNTATTSGGVYVNGTFNISGAPVISDNTITGSTTENNVYLPSGKTITIIGDIAGIGASQDTDEIIPSIGVTTQSTSPYDFAIISTDDSYADAVDGLSVLDYRSFFTSDANSYYVVALSTGLQLVQPSAPSDIEGITGDWIAITDMDGDGYIEVDGTEKTNNKITSAGNYYLAMDIQPRSAVVFGDSEDDIINFNLNGHVIDANGGSQAVVKADSTATLNLYGDGVEYTYDNGTSDTSDDISYTGGLLTGGTGNSNKGGGVTVGSSATLNMYGGTIAGNNVSGNGGGVYTQGTFVMYGGIIAGNSSSSGGGVYATGSFTMNGGEISGNTASSVGGGVYVADDLIMSGGEISDNTASKAGGVYVGDIFTMTSGTISGNTATNYAGGVHAYGEFTMSGDAEISGNKAVVGGGVYTTVKFTMNGGTISGNTATDYAGGVYTSGEFTMNGGTIGGEDGANTTADGGGGVYVAGGSFVMTDGEISYNVSDNSGGETDASGGGNGGGVYISAGEFAMSGGTIKQNVAESVEVNYDDNGNGGGVYVNKGDATFEMTGGEIVDNTAEYKGGGVYVYGEFTMSGNAEISGNTATSGGGVYVNQGLFTMKEGAPIITGNTAVFNVYVDVETNDSTGDIDTGDGGGVYVSKNAEFVMKVGTISENIAQIGGGVYVAGVDGGAGTFDMTGGSITGNLSYKGGGVYISRGVFTMNGGSITSNKVYSLDIEDPKQDVYNAELEMTFDSNISDDGNGAGVFVYTGTFNFNGGTIGGENSGNIANGNGGGVFINKDSVVTITGGTISYNTADGGAGVLAKGIITMTGGTISYNTSEDSGAGVLLDGSDAGANLSGNPVISNNIKTNGYISNLHVAKEETVTIVGALTSGADIGVKVSDDVVTFAVGAVDDSETDADESYTITLADKAYFSCDASEDGYMVSLSSSQNSLNIVSSEVVATLIDSYGATVSIYANGSASYMFEGVEYGVGTYPSDDEDWIANIDGMTGTWSAITDSDSNGYIEVGGVENYNGYYYNAIEGDGYYYLAEDIGTVEWINIYDDIHLALNGKTIEDANEYDRVFNIDTGATLNLYSDGNDYDENGDLITDETTDIAYNGGLLIGGSELKSGGVIYVYGTLNMYGGNITGGYDATNGGGVYVNGGTFNMYDGSITGNTAEYGAGVYLSSGTFNMSGGSITGNTASVYGGAVYVKNGTFNISGSSVISGNVVDDSSNDSYASNVYLVSGKTITAGELETGANIGVTLAEGYVFADDISADYSEYFTADKNGMYGVYYVASLDDDGTYDLIISEEPVTITNEMVSLVDDESVAYTSATYTGENVLPTVTVMNGNVAVEDYGLVWTDSEGNKIDIESSYELSLGTYTATVTGTEYNSGTGTATFTVEKIELTVSDIVFANKTYLETGSELSSVITYTISSGFLDGEDEDSIVVVTYYDANLENAGYNVQSGAGVYDITAVFSATEDYYTFVDSDGEDITAQTATLTIVEKFTVSFDSDGGTSVDSQTVYDGYYASSPTSPTKENSKFVGWSLDASVEEPVMFSFATAIKANTTLYAVWEDVITYTVTFDTGSGSSVDSITNIAEGATITKPTDPTYSGYIFSGWSKSEGGSTAISFATTKITDNITLYAIWEEEATYSVTYVYNDGVTENKVVDSIAYGDTETFETPTYGGEGSYTFIGWYKDSALLSYYGTETTVTSDITIYAKWAENTFTLSGDVFDGDKEVVKTDYTATLKIGNVVYQTATYDNETFTFDDVAVGSYNLVLVYGSGDSAQTVTTQIAVTADMDDDNDECIDIGDYYFSNLHLNSVLEVSGSVTDVVVSGLDSMFDKDGEGGYSESGIYNETDEALAESGSTITVVMKVEEKADGESENEGDIAEVAGSSTVGLIFEITIEKTISTPDESGESSTETTTNISELNKALGVEIILPEELRGMASYSVLRTHDGVTEALPVGESNANEYGEYIEVNSEKTILTIYGARYSTYAIAYSETAVSTSSSSSSSVSLDQSAPTLEASSTVVTASDANLLSVYINGEKYEVSGDSFEIDLADLGDGEYEIVVWDRYGRTTTQVFTVSGTDVEEGDKVEEDTGIETPTATETPSATTAPSTSDASSSSNFNWIWILLAIVVIGGVGYVVWKKKQK